jgi:hypothetical protein
VVRFGRDYKNKRRIRSSRRKMAWSPSNISSRRASPSTCRKATTSKRATYILDGNPAPHDILAIKGVEALGSYLVNEIQEVYRLQGVLINDKHIEVIVRQMLQKVEITDPGLRVSLSGEHVDRSSFDDANERLVEADGRKPASERRFCSASPRRRCRPVVHLGGVVPGDHPRAHRGRGPARSTRWKASRKTSSSAVSSRPVPAGCWAGADIGKTGLSQTRIVALLSLYRPKIWRVPRMKRSPPFKSATGMALNCCVAVRWPSVRPRNRTAQPGLKPAKAAAAS